MGKSDTSVVSNRPDEDAEVVIPGGDDASDTGYEEKHADQIVADLCTVAAKIAPARSRVEGESGECEEHDSETDADRGKDHLGHICTPRALRWCGGIYSAEVVSSRSIRFGFDPLVVLLAHLTVGALVATHAPA